MDIEVYQDKEYWVVHWYDVYTRFYDKEDAAAFAFRLAVWFNEERKR